MCFLFFAQEKYAFPAAGAEEVFALKIGGEDISAQLEGALTGAERQLFWDELKSVPVESLDDHPGHSTKAETTPTHAQQAQAQAQTTHDVKSPSKSHSPAPAPAQSPAKPHAESGAAVAHGEDAKMDSTADKEAAKKHERDSKGADKDEQSQAKRQRTA